ncbi:Na+/H+ antiporter NhaA [Thiolapillus sp.]|uniref:Na+/H+ antiporter NhaA n=1 Tax=Thiolapillus sp. TaxID=2017437 RepID=UPI003AF6A617
MDRNNPLKGKEYLAPWERAFDRVLTPLEAFIHRQTTSGILLMLCAVIALAIANSPLGEGYEHILHTDVTVGGGDLVLSMSLHHWINDGLMALFFLIVGLELKRELLVGELADPKQALLPIAAAIGGMLLPALFYFLLNQNGSEARGWGIPMATDIAFALGTLALLGKRVPPALLTFLVALAIVDDLGAVVVIALFYTADINMLALGTAGGILLLLIALNRGGIRRVMPYGFLGVLLWLAMLKSGVHATLAGVFLAFTIPMKPKLDTPRFLANAKGLLDEIRAAHDQEPNIILNDRMRGRISALSEGVSLAQSPAQILEHQMHISSAYLIIPVFALANAGIPIDFGAMDEIFADSVALGVIMGLVLGKLLGIAGMVWLMVKLGWSHLLHGLGFGHIMGAALMGGIGFTMSIFVAELAFANDPKDLLMAKTGVLLASLIAGVTGFLWLRIISSK